MLVELPVERLVKEMNNFRERVAEIVPCVLQ